MDDPNQIEVPPSFMALYTTPSGHRLTQTMAAVRERYELCEDMAQMLTDHAPTSQPNDARSEGNTLARMQSALQGPDSPVEPTEAAWVIRRLAELLGWEPPAAA